MNYRNLARNLNVYLIKNNPGRSLKGLRFGIRNRDRKEIMNVKEIIKKDLDKFAGFRKPTITEADCIKRYMNAYYSKGEKISNIALIIFILLSVMFFLSFAEYGAKIIFVGVVFLGFVIKTSAGNKKNKKMNEYYQKGQFEVLDGYISEWSTDTTTVNQDSVKFISTQGQLYDQWIGVKTRNLKEGEYLLLVYCRPARDVRVFSKDMLTEDGIKHTI